MKNQVLIISCLFPPNNTIGAVRMGKFCKYLNEFDWEPLVITMDDRHYAHKTLPVEIDRDKIYRLPTFALSDLFRKKTEYEKRENAEMIKESEKIKYDNKWQWISPILQLPIINELIFGPWGWHHYAMKKGDEIIKHNNIKVVFSTYSPLVNHVVASKLCQKNKLPWVAEFRDPWSLNPYFKQKQPFFTIEKQIEKKVMRGSTNIIAISKNLAEQVEGLHSKKVWVIPNGYDEEDYNKEVEQLNKFTITYTGTIYPNKRDPTPLLKAIDNLNKKGKILPNDVTVRFYGGNVKTVLLPLLNKEGLKEGVECHETIPFKESIIKQKESTILLLLSWNDVKDKGTLTAKVFEYIGAGKPILAHAYKNGEIDKLLRETRCGVVINDVYELERILLQWLDEFNKFKRITTYYNPDKALIKEYTRKEQTKKLVQIFNLVSKKT